MFLHFFLGQVSGMRTIVENHSDDGENPTEQWQRNIESVTSIHQHSVKPSFSCRLRVSPPFFHSNLFATGPSLHRSVCKTKSVLVSSTWCWIMDYGRNVLQQIYYHAYVNIVYTFPEKDTFLIFLSVNNSVFVLLSIAPMKRPKPTMS